MSPRNRNALLFLLVGVPVDVLLSYVGVVTNTRVTHKCEDITWTYAQSLLAEGHTYLDRDGDGEACEANK